MLKKTKPLMMPWHCVVVFPLHKLRVDKISKEVVNNSCAAVYRPEYAEWPTRGISETAENLHPGEENSAMEGGGPEGWSSFLC